MERSTVSSGSKWESVVGYSRAGRVGAHVSVAGTTAVDENGEVVGKGDPYIQATYILRRIEGALREVGAAMKDVVRTRMYVTDISMWGEVGRAHGESFLDIRPAATMVEVARLIEPELQDIGGDVLMVEIEVEAMVTG